MSGVIDENGTQWEHCCDCGGWVRIQDLHYLEAGRKLPDGRTVGEHGIDLCRKCADKAHGVETD